MGIVGAGGNFGAAIFSVFFVCFSYKAAFILMGLSAMASSLLTLFLQTDKLAKTYDAVILHARQLYGPGDETNSEQPGSLEAAQVRDVEEDNPPIEDLSSSIVVVEEDFVSSEMEFGNPKEQNEIMLQNQFSC